MINKYTIVLKKETEVDFIKKLSVKPIEIHMNIIVFAYLTKESCEFLNEHHLVESIEIDENIELPDGSEDELPVTQSSVTTTYAFDFMNIKQFHNEGLKGQGMKIAILDTGIQQHFNLKIKEGINTYDNNQAWDLNLTNAHGTRVAGILNAQGLNNEVIGIAPEAEIYCARIDNGNGSINTTTWSSQISAISWAIEKGVDAINCSFSSRIDNKARKTAFKIASDLGIAIFCSAGNNQPLNDNVSNTARYPAKYPFTIASANILPNKEKYWSSCIGQGINYSNGGVKVYSTTTDKNSFDVSDKHIIGTGTSFASPATLGIYILYKQKYKENKSKILQRMTVNAENLGDNYWYGAGIPKYPTNNYNNIQIKG